MVIPSVSNKCVRLTFKHVVNQNHLQVSYNDG